jgi:starvation-inducible DNA-binding protein
MEVKRKGDRDVQTTSREISGENREESPVVEALRQQCANAVMLYFNYKHYHWNTFGPLFRDLHKLFDELAEEVHETLDPLAERIRMIGQDPPAHPIEAVDLATVPVPAPDSTMREAIEDADRNLLVVIKELRQGVATADEHDDPGTVDLLSKIVQVHEKHEWWLRDILRKGDGLIQPASA